jgi:hypothetical protein
VAGLLAKTEILGATKANAEAADNFLRKERRLFIPIFCKAKTLFSV